MRPTNDTRPVGRIETVPIGKVWPNEATDFTPWLRSHIGELDEVLGLGLTNAQSEVGAGDFRIDLVAETNFGEVVIENQYGRSDHRHLGQLVTYFSHRDVRRAIWIVEGGRPEHVTAVESLNARGVGQIWMVSVRTIRIGDSAPAPLFTVLAAPSEVAMSDATAVGRELSPGEIRKRNFMATLFQQAREDGIASPFKDLTPNIGGLQHTHARGSGLLFRVAVNQRESRVVVTNALNRWTAALDELAAKRTEIDRAFADAGLPKKLYWTEQVTSGRWWIRYTVAAGYKEEPDLAKLRELNLASAAMQQVFEPYLNELDPKLEAPPSELPR